MLGGAVVGAVVGSQIAPKDAQKPEHYTGLGAMGGLGAGAVCGELFFSDTARANRLEKKNYALENPPNFVKLKGNTGKLKYPKKSQVKDSFEYRLYEFKKHRWLHVGDKKYRYDAYIQKSDPEEKKKDKNEK